jgi:hypothetical protein
MGRIRLHVALDCSGYSLETFILDNIEPGATIATDKWPSYNIIDKEQYRRETTNQSKSSDHENLYGVHLVTTLVKRLIRGTYQGRFEPKYLQNYLDEYVFRFNRRNQGTSVKSSCVSSSRWFNLPGSCGTQSNGIWTPYLSTLLSLELHREAYIKFKF